MKISARNKLGGKLVEVRKGQTTAHRRLDKPGLRTGPDRRRLRFRQ